MSGQPQLDQARAAGLHVEASLVVRLKMSSPIFTAAAEYLARMQGIAAPFDLAKVEVYKQLQRKMTNGARPVMELQAEDAASAGNSTITVFGPDRTDLKKLGTVRREIHVALLDPRTDAQFLYPATILHSGLLPASDASAGRISFSPRRFAYRKGRQFATLQPLGPVDAAVLNAAEYFVTVHLGKLEPGLVAEAPAPRAVTLEEVSDHVSPLVRRLDEPALAQLFGRREVRINRPAVAAAAAPPMTVASLRVQDDHHLVSLRVLVKKLR